MVFMKKIEKNHDFYFPKWKNDGKIVRREKLSVKHSVLHDSFLPLKYVQNLNLTLHSFWGDSDHFSSF